MAIAPNDIQVTWSAANSLSVASGVDVTSDVATLSATMFAAAVQVKAKNDGSPASGDVITGQVLVSLGDPDAVGGDEFDTPEHAIPFSLDTAAEDPAIATFPIEPTAKAVQVHVFNNAASNAITVSATVREKLQS